MLSEFHKFFEKNNDKEIIMRETADPEFLIWSTLCNTEFQNNINRFLSIISVLSIVILTFIFVLLFKQHRIEKFNEINNILGEKGIKGIKCISINHQQAFDAQKQFELGARSYKWTLEMFCFCMNSFYE